MPIPTKNLLTQENLEKYEDFKKSELLVEV